MAEVWRTAVVGNDAVKLCELVLSSAASPEAALEVVRNCAALLEKETSSTTGHDPAVAPSPSNGQHAEAADGDVPPLMCTLEGVQLLHPRGRFNLEFRKSGVTITGKAATLDIAWHNVRHIIRLPRPEGYNWGKSLDQSDPAGSDLLALPLKQPVPLRKTEAALILLQPDPKASHAEVSIALDGVSHKVSGSQGTVIGSLLELLCGVKQSVPDKGLFASRGGKSFVKCYYGVNEGSLFPLRQGLFFMKPALFLPKGDIEQVVCGRGGSATTRYVDLVVGMEAGENEKESTREFSNIVREDLPGLQNYIQDALVTPRLREAKKAAKAAAAKTVAPSPAKPVQSETCEETSTAPEQTATSNRSTAPPPGSGDSGGEAGSRTSVGRQDVSSEAAKNGVAPAAEEDEEDDGDAESDEDFAPVAGHTDSDDDSGSSVSSASGGSDDDSGSESEEEGGDDPKEQEEEGEEDNDEEQDEAGRGGKEGDDNVDHRSEHKKKRLHEDDVYGQEFLHRKKKQAAATKVSTETVGSGVTLERGGGAEDDGNKGGDDTESDEDGRRKKRAA